MGDKSCLDWLELELEDDMDDDELDETAWILIHNDHTTGSSTISASSSPSTRTLRRQLRVDNLRPMPSSPTSSTEPCFIMGWILHWLSARTTEPHQPVAMVSPLLDVKNSGSPATTTCALHMKNDTTADSCCSSTSASSSILDEDFLAGPKLVGTHQGTSTTTMRKVLHPTTSHGALGNRLLQGGSTQDFDYREYLTTGKRCR